MENLRKRKDIRLCTHADSFVSYSSRPLFKRAVQIDDNLTEAVMIKERIILDRPVYIGQAVLDLSKLRMYRLQYVELERYRQLYPQSSITILAGDTDSFFLEVRNLSLTNTLLPAMKNDGLLDTSNYPCTSPLFSRDKENKIGLFKDESGGVADYLECIFLRPKTYSMHCSDISDSCHRAKGIQKATTLTHELYRNIYLSYNPSQLDTQPPLTHSVEQRNIVSQLHQLYTVSYNKRALSIMDDKRVWVESNLSLPYGHYRIT